jgi:hypothetical protein
MKPPHSNIIIPVGDLVSDLRSKLATFDIKPAGFEEIVRQCFDIYMDWSGDEEHVRLVPFFNRIEIPAMTGDQYQRVYDAVQYHVHVFAKALFSRLMEHGFFPKSHSGNMDYAFAQFVDNDVMLQYFNF